MVGMDNTMMEGPEIGKDLIVSKIVPAKNLGLIAVNVESQLALLTLHVSVRWCLRQGKPSSSPDIVVALLSLLVVTEHMAEFRLSAGG